MSVAAIKLVCLCLTLGGAYLARFRGSAWCFVCIGAAIFLSVKFIPEPTPQCPMIPQSHEGEE